MLKTSKRLDVSVRTQLEAEFTEIDLLKGLFLEVVITWTQKQEVPSYLPNKTVKYWRFYWFERSLSNLLRVSWVLREDMTTPVSKTKDSLSHNKLRNQSISTQKKNQHSLIVGEKNGFQWYFCTWVIMYFEQQSIYSTSPSSVPTEQHIATHLTSFTCRVTKLCQEDHGFTEPNLL